jgi:hypothetical protein
MEARLPLIAAIGPVLGSIGGALGGARGIAALAGAGSSIYGAVNSANATGAAAKAQQAAATQAAANFAPWLSGGQSALAQQMQLLGLGGGGMGGAGGQPNYSAYVTGNPDVMAAYQSGAGKGASIEDFGKWHWDTFGQNEFNAKDPNRTLTPFGPGGAGGAGGQQSAIDALKQSPFYQSLYHNGEQAILANGAATGGLRGGNTQRSLYNLGTDTLASAFQQQFNNLGTLSGLGENAAAGVGKGQLLAGQAQAGGIVRGATATNNIANTVADLPSLFGNQQLLSALGLGGGVKAPSGSLAAASPDIQGTFAGLF